MTQEERAFREAAGSIRPAARKDYEAVTQIMGQVQALHADWRPDIYRPVEKIFSKEEYEQLLEKDTVWVAEAASRVCAVLILTERVAAAPTQVPRRILFVDSLAVDEPMRGQGIGARLMRQAVQTAREQGYDGIELQVNARNTHAKAFYEGLGFTDKSIHMEFLWHEQEDRS